MKFLAWLAYHLETREIVEDYIQRARTAIENSGHELVICESETQAAEEIVDADVMLGWRITPGVFDKAQKLKWIQFGSAGIDHTIFPELLASSVILTNMSGIHIAPVAEHVLATMLALTRKLDAAVRLQDKRDYDRSEIAATADELAGKTVGIIGLGKIGLSIARLSKAFGMRVIGTKKSVEGPLSCVDAVYTPNELATVLAQSDILVLVMPLTNETRALIGHTEIESMKEGAYLINVARGAMLDHEALAEALRSGKLRGAALDVFPREPLTADSSIYDLPNTIITPHTAGSSPRYAERAAEIFRHNLEAFLTDGEMINIYDRKRGY